jgi:hypothetical protein
METIIVHPKNSKEQKVITAFLEALKIKFEDLKKVSEESNYDAEFVASMERSIQDAKEGKLTRMELDDIWK